MKLAYIVPSLAQRGPVLVVFHLVQEMLAHGHECTVYYFGNKSNLSKIVYIMI